MVFSFSSFSFPFLLSIALLFYTHLNKGAALPAYVSLVCVAGYTTDTRNTKHKTHTKEKES